MTLKYYLYPLTVEETTNAAGKYSGARSVFGHRERWIDLSGAENTAIGPGSYEELYNPNEKTFIVHDGVVYQPFKNYIDIDKGEKIIVGKRYDFAYDIEPETPAEDKKSDDESTTEKKPDTRGFWEKEFEERRKSGKV